MTWPLARQEIIVVGRSPPSTAGWSPRTPLPEPFDTVSSGPKMRKFRCVASARHVAQKSRQHMGIADACTPRARDIHRVVAKVRHAQIAQQHARRWRGDWRPCAFALGASAASSGLKRARLVEQLLGTVAAQPFLQLLEVLRIRRRIRERHLMRAESALDLLSVDELRARSILWASAARSSANAAVLLRRARAHRRWISRISLDDPIQRRGHRLVHRHRARRPRRNTVVQPQPRSNCSSSSRAMRAEHRGIGDLVAVQMQNRQYRAVGRRDSGTCWNATTWPAVRSRPRRRRSRRPRSARDCRIRRRRHGSANSRAHRPRGSIPGISGETWLGMPPGNENCVNSRFSPVSS